MTQLDVLNEKYSADGAVRFDSGNGGLPRATISSPTASAEIYLHGAHLTRFEQKGQGELLFMSSRSFYEAAKPIRGGVPVIFPWFGPRNDADRSRMHGFVRTMPWEVRGVSQRGDGVDVILGVSSDEGTRGIWPGDFDANFTVGVGPVLRMSLSIRNASSQPFAFEEALHTYFAVSDIRQVSVAGLRGHYYRDRNVSDEFQMDRADAITFERRTDRLYRDARTICVISDPGMRREIVVAKENSATTVVWNPWEMAPGEFPDIGEQDWRRFVCVETANARENTYTLAPGETHTMSAIISARSIAG